MNEVISKEFTLQKDIIHLNHAGVSPWPVRTAEAVGHFADENSLLGSLNYPQWVKAETGLRVQLQKLINAASKDDIALLKSTSEALSVVAYGLDWKQSDNIVISNQEFPSNRIVWESLSHKGVELREADLLKENSPEDALFSLTDSNTRLISISSVQYSTGLQMDLPRIGTFCRDRGILFCVDAIQSIGAVEFDVQSMKADYVMADGHKWMLGPEGLALFYSTPEARDRLSLNQYGWHMVEAIGDFERKDWTPARTARRFECGSPNMLGIRALSASLSLLLETGMEHVEREVIKRTEYLFEKIIDTPELELITSPEKGRYAGIATLRKKDADNTALYEYLMSKNVLCAPRSGGIRLSPHFYTPLVQLDDVIELIADY